MAPRSRENVFLFIPNLIGYARVVLAGVALYMMPSQPLLSIGLYCLSCILDAVDGHAARYFKQSSRFGAVLDMVTDRCGTTCLLCYLAGVYPDWALLFQFLISLDISSHWIHMYSSLLGGAASHKRISKSSNPILRAYYSYNVVLFLFCAGNELFFVCLYALSSEGGHKGPMYRLPFVPGGREVTLIHLAAAATLPICTTKQVINVIQFVGAAKALARIDLEERERAAAGLQPVARTVTAEDSRKDK